MFCDASERNVCRKTSRFWFLVQFGQTCESVQKKLTPLQLNKPQRKTAMSDIMDHGFWTAVCYNSDTTKNHAQANRGTVPLFDSEGRSRADLVSSYCHDKQTGTSNVKKHLRVNKNLSSLASARWKYRAIGG